MVVAVCVMSAIVAASASAALPELVNKEGKALVKNKFTAEIPGWKSLLNSTTISPAKET